MSNQTSIAPFIYDKILENREELPFCTTWVLAAVTHEVRDQETQTERRPDRRTLGLPRDEANEKRAAQYRQRMTRITKTKVLKEYSQ